MATIEFIVAGIIAIALVVLIIGGVGMAWFHAGRSYERKRIIHEIVDNDLNLDIQIACVILDRYADWRRYQSDFDSRSN